MCRRKSEIFRGAGEGLALSADGDKTPCVQLRFSSRGLCLGPASVLAPFPLESLRTAKTVKDDTQLCKWRG